MRKPFFQFISISLMLAVASDQWNARAQNNANCPSPAYDALFSIGETKKSMEDVPRGIESAFLTGVCTNFFHSSKSKNLRNCENQRDFSHIRTSSHEHACFHDVKAILNTMSLREFGHPMNFEQSEARYAGKDLIASNLFKNIYDPNGKSRPGPKPSGRLEVRVYSGGSYLHCGSQANVRVPASETVKSSKHGSKSHHKKRAGGGEACGHVEVCFLGRCTSDYMSDRPIDWSETSSGKTVGTHTLTGIYVLDSEPNQSQIGKK